MAIATVSAQETIISVEPQSYTAEDIGDVFTINVTVYNVADLYGFELKLRYNTTILDITKATIQPFLNEPTYTVKNEILEDEGRYWLAVASQRPAEPKSGSGPLVTLTFKVTGIGICALHLYDVKLADSEANAIFHRTIDGKVTSARDIWLEPSFTGNLHKSDNFTVSIVVNITAPTRGGGNGMYMWEYNLTWETDWLSLVDHDPVIYSGVNDIILGWHTNYYIATDDVGANYHWYAVSALSPAPAFTGVVWLCNYTFHVEDQPYEPEPAYTGEFSFHLEAIADDKVQDIINPDDWVIGTFRIQPATRSGPLPVENIAIVIVVAIFFVAVLYYVKKRILK